jgi:hypothetical protein
MAFGNVEPEKIIGMKPEELKARLDAAVTKTDLDDLAKKQNEVLTSSLAELRESLQKLTTAPDSPEPVREPPDPTTEVLTDPTKFVREQTKGLADAQIETKAQVQEIRARQNPKFSQIFQQYGDELMKEAMKCPPQTRAQDNFWEFMTRSFLGDKFLKGEIKESSYPSLIGTSTAITGSSGGPDDPNRGFDPAVVEHLKKRGIPLDQAAHIRDIQRTGEPITLENYKAAGNA